MKNFKEWFEIRESFVKNPIEQKIAKILSNMEPQNFSSADLAVDFVSNHHEFPPQVAGLVQKAISNWWWNWYNQHMADFKKAQEEEEAEYWK